MLLEELATAKADAPLHAPMQLEFDNHDSIFNIVEIVQEKQLFADNGQAAEFAIGLKMFSEVMIKNKNHPLFEELIPAFGLFMKKLKSYAAASSSEQP